MASYQYLDMCYGTTQDLYTAIASSCPVTNSLGWSIVCTPTATGYTIKNYVSDTGFKTQTIIPTLKNCSYDVVDSAELAWLVVGVFLVAWAIRQNMTILRMR